jgi:hypothetical protein
MPLLLLLLGMGAVLGQRGRPPIRPPEPIMPRPPMVRPEPFRPPSFHPEPIMPRPPVFEPPAFRPEPFVSPSGGRVARTLPREFVTSHVEVYRSASANPIRALEEVTQASRNKVLSRYEHQFTIQESLNELARSVPTSRDPWANAQAVKGLQAPAESFSPAERAQLSAINARLQREVVQRGVAEVVELGTRGNVTPTRVAAREWLTADARLFAGREAQLPAEHATVRKSLQAIETSLQQVEGLGRLEAAVRLEREPAARFLEAFNGVEKQALSPELRQVADGLRGLAELRTQTETPWKEPPNVAVLKRSVDAFERGLAGRTSEPGSSNLSGRLRQDLAMKAFFEGHVQAARELWPANGSPEHAANLLRDMKALVTGQGEVTTEAGRQGLPPASNQGGGKPPGPPPGLKFLLPEEPGDGWRPPVRGKATEGLPPLQEAARLAEPLQEAVAEQLPREREALAGHVQFHVQELHRVQLRMQQKDRDEKEKIELFEKALAVPLQPAERVWVGQQLREGKPQEKVAEELKEKWNDEEIERALTVLKAYLAPKLTPESLAEFLEKVTKRKVKFEKFELTGRDVGPDQRMAWANQLLPSDLTESAQEHAEKELIGAGRQLLHQGVEIPDLVDLFEPVLSQEQIKAAGDVRQSVQLDMIALELGSGLGAFEYAQAQALIAAKKKPAEVAAVLRQQRQRERRKSDLERVKSYLDRPPTEAELKKARQLLEEDKEVADVVASLPEALSSERRTVDGGVREAVLLDEIRQALNPGPDATEYALARQKLRAGSKSAQVVGLLASRRAKAFEEVVQKRLEQVNARVANQNANAANELKAWEREQAEDMLRNGLSVEETFARIQRVRKHLAGDN